MTAPVRSDQRHHSKTNPCAGCGGGYDLPSGRGIRCAGFVHDEPDYFTCTRHESPRRSPRGFGWSHYRGPAGVCDCGADHSAGPPPVRLTQVRAPLARAESSRGRRAGRGPVVTVEALAADKALPAEELRRFGLLDTRDGVRVEYAAPDGTPARARLRSSLRATEGTRWLGSADEPMALYSRRESLDRAGERGRLFLVEGESDAWTGWHYGLAVIGIPGSGLWRLLDEQHLDGVRELYVLREPDTAAYVEGVALRTRELGWDGSVYALVMPDGIKDLNELHKDDPEWFLERLNGALSGARLVEPDAPPQTGVLLSDVLPEEVEWLWEGRIPLGKITLLDGDPGLGKSSITMGLAALVSRGAPMPDGTPGVDGGVVVLSAEDALADTIRPRLDAAGADTTRIVALPVVGVGDEQRLPAIPTDLSEIEAAIGRVSAKLVTVDPLMAYLGSEVNAHRDQDVRRALAQLSGLAERTGAAVVIVRHLNKAAGGSAIYRGGGSIGLAGAARSVLLVAEEPDEPQLRVLAPVKSNLGPPPPSLSYRLVGADNGAVAVEWLGPSEHTATQLLAAHEGGEESGALAEAKRFLEEQLADGPMLASEVEAARRRNQVASERTLKRARAALGVLTEPVREDGKKGVSAWRWSLPGGLEGQRQGLALYSDSDAKSSPELGPLERVGPLDGDAPGESREDFTI